MTRSEKNVKRDVVTPPFRKLIIPFEMKSSPVETNWFNLQQAKQLANNFLVPELQPQAARVAKYDPME